MAVTINNTVSSEELPDTGMPQAFSYINKTLTHLLTAYFYKDWLPGPFLNDGSTRR